jgi:plastocyanin
MPRDQDTVVAAEETWLNRRQLIRLGAALSALGGLSGVAGSTLGQGAATPIASPTACAATPAANSSASPAASPDAVVTVEMTQDLRFEPQELTVQVGQTVRWVNASAMPHTATGDPEQNPVEETNPEYVRLPKRAEPWRSELLQAGDTYEHIFNTPGRYDYLCIPHVLSGMRGAIIVEC